MVFITLLSSIGSSADRMRVLVSLSSDQFICLNSNLPIFPNRAKAKFISLVITNSFVKLPRVVKIKGHENVGLVVAIGDDIESYLL